MSTAALNPTTRTMQDDWDDFLEGKVKRSEAHVRKIEVHLCNGLPGFGAFLLKDDSAAGDEPEIVLLNLKLAVEAVKSQEGEASEVVMLVSETLAHELLHIVQEMVGARLDEGDVEKAMSMATGESVEIFDSEEQAISELYERALAIEGERNAWKRYAEALEWWNEASEAALYNNICNKGNFYACLELDDISDRAWKDVESARREVKELTT